MFCIINEIAACRRKNLIKYENEHFIYYELFCKKLSRGMRRRIEQKLGCPIIFSADIHSEALQLKILENILLYFLKKNPAAQVAIVEHPQPDVLLQRIIPYCADIRLVHCAAIDTAAYLRAFGYAPVQLDQYGDETIIFKYTAGKLYCKGQKIVLEQDGYILPEYVAEMLPQGISELSFVFLLWKYAGYDVQDLLPGDVIHFLQ